MPMIYVAIKALIFLGILFFAGAIILALISIWYNILGYNEGDLGKYAVGCLVTAFVLYALPVIVLFYLEWFSD